MYVGSCASFCSWERSLLRLEPANEWHWSSATPPAKHAPALPTTLNDSTDVGAALERLGFSVMRVDDADQGELRGGLRELAAAAKGADSAVVFYAGHGIGVEERNFLVPVDAELVTDLDIEFETVALEFVERAVSRASGVRLIILDASRENPFLTAMQHDDTTVPVGPGLVRIEPSPGTLVAYAAREGTVALEGEGGNSRMGGQRRAGVRERRLPA